MPFFATAGTKVYIGAALAMKSTDFVIGDFSTQTWTQITGLEQIGSLGDQSQAIVANVIDEARDKTIKGTRAAGTMELVCELDYTSAGQLAAIAAEKTPYDYAFKVVLPDTPAAVSATVTMTIATPGVITWTAHGRVAGDTVVFSTTGALPTGLTAGTTYYVKQVLTADTFTVSATSGGAAIATSGTQSGTHTGTTIPTPSERYFVGKVMSAVEQLDQANSIQKLQISTAINSNVVRKSASAI